MLLQTDFLAQYGVSWTVGLVVTFTTVACVIAADTGAYFVGKWILLSAGLGGRCAHAATPALGECLSLKVQAQVMHLCSNLIHLKAHPAG